MAFRFLFWDNDGVLVDTERHYFQASLEALARVGITLEPDEFARISLAQGRSIFALAGAAGHGDAELDVLRRWRNDRYLELLDGANHVLPGVREVLSNLHRRIGMAIVTSSLRNHFLAIHRRSQLLPFFDFVLTREDYRHSKPDPEPYLLALANSGLPAEKCLVIEDSPRGLAAAKAAGLTCWVIPSRETRALEFPGADRILERITDLPKLIV